VASEFKAYVKSARQKHDGLTFSARDVLTAEGDKHDSLRLPLPPRIFMHVDMDCFFVSVGLLKRPDLRGRPVAVAHTKLKAPCGGEGSTLKGTSWSEISSCSYEARAAGVKNGVFIYLPYNDLRYNNVSQVVL